MESEKTTERYLAREVGRMGGECLKYANGNKSGYPDRLCLLPGGRAFWVELKSSGLEPRPLQWERIRRLRALGQRVFVADSRDCVDKILSRYAPGEGAEP